MEVELHDTGWDLQKKQVQRLREVKRERDNRKVLQLLKDLEGTAKAEKNVMPCLLECCRAYATVGEMTKVSIRVSTENSKEPSRILKHGILIIWNMAD